MDHASKGKVILGYSIAGLTFAVLTTISIGILSSTIGLEFDNNVEGIIAGLFSGDVVAILLTVLTAIIFGTFIWLYGYIGGSLMAKLNNKSAGKLPTRPRIIGLFLMGVLGVGILGIVDQILAGVGTTTNPQGLLAFDNPIGVIVQFIAYSVLGFAVIWLGSKYPALQKPIPDSLKKV